MPCSRRGVLGPMALAALASALLAPSVAASADDKVSVKVTKLEDEYSRLHFFENTPNVYLQTSSSVLISTDEGANWNAPKGISSSFEPALFEPSPYNTANAWLLGSNLTHYRTSNSGANWSLVPNIPDQPAFNPRTSSVIFHHSDPNYIIYNGKKCTASRLCHQRSYYTIDGGSTWNLLMTYTEVCLWGSGSKYPGEKNSVLCTAHTVRTGKQTFPATGTDRVRLYKSTDFQKWEVLLDDVVNLSIMERFLLVAQQPKGLYELNLFVSSSEGENSVTELTQATFPYDVDLVENGYLVFTTATGSLAVDVYANNKPKREYGMLYLSDSKGLEFSLSLRYTNRDSMQRVDLEQIAPLEGYFIANEVYNGDSLASDGEKIIKTRVSYDNGNRWHLLTPPEKDLDGKLMCAKGVSRESCSLHLHSYTDDFNEGMIFSSSSSPGLLIGVGNVGDRLKHYQSGDTYLSNDGGRTWIMVKKGAHMYEIGDRGSIQILFDDLTFTDTIYYSVDYGKTWNSYTFDFFFRGYLLTTEPESTSLKFVMVGWINKYKNQDALDYLDEVVVHIDFTNVLSRQCDPVTTSSDGDFELWKAYSSDSDNGGCLLGKKVSYYRRKEDSLCFIGEKYTDLRPSADYCTCTNDDFECDVDFERDDTDMCVPDNDLVNRPPAGCQKGDTYVIRSGYRKIPGDVCQGGIKLDAPKNAVCPGSADTGNDDDDPEEPPINEQDGISVQATYFADKIQEFTYLKQSTTMFLLDYSGVPHVSRNEGTTWRKIKSEISSKRIIKIITHPYDNARAYLLTSENVLYYTKDAGATIQSISLPAEPNKLGISVLSFHPDHNDWLIFIGGEGCISGSTTCKSLAFYTKDHGSKWTQFETYSEQCVWGRAENFRDLDESSIFCLTNERKEGKQDQFTDTDRKLLVRSDNLFSSKKTLVEDVIAFVIYENFIAVALIDKTTAKLQLKISLNGDTFSRAKFPLEANIEENGYTILESSTGSIFIDVFENTQFLAESGTIYISNAEGTSFSTSIRHTNRNMRGYVDFEKIQGIPGIAIANVVSNMDEVKSAGEDKLLKSKITFDDGAFWNDLTPPRKNVNGKVYDCATGSRPTCTLHLHSITERRNVGKMFSASSALGLVMGVGNVGPSLTEYTEGDMFLSRDAGATWSNVALGAHMFEFGDRGAIIILVDDENPTTTLQFSADSGYKWFTYTFSDNPVRISSVTTEPESTSQKFLIVGKDQTTRNDVAISVDFTSFRRRKCVFDKENAANSDFEAWKPSEYGAQGCHLGQVTTYYRRKPSADCYIGELYDEFDTTHELCPCTAFDFQCDIDFIRNGTACVPEDGTPAEGMCDDSNMMRTGYRKSALTMCDKNLAGSVEMETPSKKCDPSLSKTKTGTSASNAGAIAAGVVVPIVVIAAAVGGWWMWRRRGGQIRLPEIFESGPRYSRVATDDAEGLMDDY